MRIRKYINKHFNIAYFIAYLAPIYLVGGAIRDLIYATNPKDLDFVVLGKENLDWVLSVFDRFNIKYELNRFEGLNSIIIIRILIYGFQMTYFLLYNIMLMEYFMI